MCTNFNPHSHKGSDGITAAEMLQQVKFQSTLPQRERRIFWVLERCTCRFQSTLPQRERRVSVGYMVDSWEISIHTPTKGATSSGAHDRCADQYFNPHSHKGSDPCGHKQGRSIRCISIHTPTKGATRKKRTKTICKLNFNPHSHKGSDGQIQIKDFWDKISIHTPTKGATDYLLQLLESLPISIHTPTKGATLMILPR